MKIEFEILPESTIGIFPLLQESHHEYKKSIFIGKYKDLKNIKHSGSTNVEARVRLYGYKPIDFKGVLKNNMITLDLQADDLCLKF